MNIAPIIEAFEKPANEGKNISYRLVHPGRHDDKKMSGSLLKNWEFPNQILTSNQVVELKLNSLES